MDQYKKYDLLDNNRAIERGLVGAVVIVFLGLTIPQTMFWGEYLSFVLILVVRGVD